MEACGDRFPRRQAENLSRAAGFPQDPSLQAEGCLVGEHSLRPRSLEQHLDRYGPGGLAVPFGEPHAAAFNRQLLEAQHCSEAEGGGAGLGELPGDAAYSCLSYARAERRPEGDRRQLGHTLDVNLNVYTEAGLQLRREAVDRFQATLEGTFNGVEMEYPN